MASSRLQQIKAKGLAEKRKQQATGSVNVESCFFRQLKEASLHPRVIKQARKTGVLNLSNRGIAEMPDIVWNITSLTAEETKELSVSLDSQNDEDKWWDYVEMNKLVLASNTLRSVSPAISNYKKLSVLDLHDNCLSDLPATLGELTFLTKLNISRNQFEKVPDCVFSLKSLKSFLAQHNKLKSLNDDISNLSFLEELDLSHNQLKRLPHCIGFLSRATDLNISNNELVSLPVEIGDMGALKHLDASKNKLKSLPELMEMLHHLEQLYIQHNAISELPLLANCHALKKAKVGQVIAMYYADTGYESWDFLLSHVILGTCLDQGMKYSLANLPLEIHAGFNNISVLTPEFCETITGIKILDLRDNKISELSDAVCSLTTLERLDLSNNDLSSLPYTLGTLPHLKFLAIDGNPMRSIRRDIIQRGTVQLLRWLRSRIADPSSLNQGSRPSSVVDSGQEQSCDVDKYALKSTRSLVLSGKNLSTVPKETIETAVSAEVTSIDFSKNNLESIPDHFESILPKLTEANFGYNKLKSLPIFIGLAQNLQYIDLRNNQLSTFPLEMSNMSHLREINICCNRFQCIPSALFALNKLEIILASDNQIESIDVAGLSKLKALAVLDLHNNSIKTVPPELGNLTQLRSVLLDGNLFRNPRPAILSKGTLALLEFLRSRIPQS